MAGARIVVISSLTSIFSGADDVRARLDRLITSGSARNGDRATPKCGAGHRCYFS
jgi:hypothetical protein